MRISGVLLAKEIRPIIKLEAEKLIENGFKASLAIITLGDTADWEGNELT